MTTITNVIETDNDVNKKVEVMLSTIDNPYNPFTHYDEWFAFDTEHNYNTCSYLARILNTSDELSETDQAIALKSAIDEIIKYNILGIYIKVTPESFKKSP